MGFKTTFKAGYVKRILPVCNVGLLLSSQTINQEPTIRTVGLPELEMRMKINQPLRRKKCNSNDRKTTKRNPNFEVEKWTPFLGSIFEKE